MSLSMLRYTRNRHLHSAVIASFHYADGVIPSSLSYRWIHSDNKPPGPKPPLQLSEVRRVNWVSTAAIGVTSILFIPELHAFGWTFALGMYSVLLSRTIGQSMMLSRYGSRFTFAELLPIYGATVPMQEPLRSDVEEANIAFAGSAVNVALSIVLIAVGDEIGSQFLLGLGDYGAYISMANLLSMKKLDGGRMNAVLRPTHGIISSAALTALLYSLLPFEPEHLVIVTTCAVYHLRRWWINANDVIHPHLLLKTSTSSKQQYKFIFAYILFIFLSCAGAAEVEAIRMEIASEAIDMLLQDPDALAEFMEKFGDMFGFQNDEWEENDHNNPVDVDDDDDNSTST